MGVSENDSPQATLVEAQKRRREQEASDSEAEGDAAETRHPKRPRPESPASESAGAEENGVMGQNERSRSQSSNGYGSEEGEVDEERAQEASPGKKTEEGEVLSPSGDERMDSSDSEDSSDEEDANAGVDSSPSSSEVQTSAGWNKGISAGQVQVSLSSMTKKAPSAPVTDVSKASEESKVSKETSLSPQSSRLPLESASATGPHFQKSGISLKLPPPGDRNAGESWQVRFQDWTNSLLKLNPEQVSVVTPELILDSYNHFIDRVCPIHNKKKRAAKQGAELFSQKGSLSRLLSLARGEEPDLSPREEANGEMNQSNGASGHGGSQAAQSRTGISLPSVPTAVDWEFALEGKSAPQTSTDENGEISLNGASSGRSKQNGSSIMSPMPPPPSSIPSGNEELKLQLKYFPRFDESMASEMCVLCLQHGHHATYCPDNGCKHCGARYQHCSSGCPSKRRCGRCKSLGHGLKDCTYDEVTRNQEDPVACAHCGGVDHYEKDCDVLWRTYRVPDSPKKCHTIVSTCASCGDDGHYFFDCEAGRLRFPKPRTWCEENLTRYLDKSSKRAPLSDVKPEPALRRPELVGRSDENIYFESDDSEGEAPFIGNPVQPKKSVGRINVSSNIQFAGQARGSESDSRLPPPASLPPRPHSFADTFRSEMRQQDGGRRQHQLPPRPPATNRGGASNYQAVPPPPGLQRNPSQGRDNSGGNSRGGRKSGRGGRGGGRGNGRGGNPRSNRGGGKWQ